ncbi:MAG: carboxypeptidase-like regulatory domain-containing protein [Thermoanaerobaculia bacterium]
MVLKRLLDRDRFPLSTKWRGGQGVRPRRAGSLSLLPILGLALLPPALRAEPPRSEITLALKDYLSLVEQGEAAEKERQRREASREAPVAEVVSQQVRVSLGQEDVAEAVARYEVLVQGQPKGPVVLPVTGVPREASVDVAGAALSAGAKAGEWLLVAPAAGRYAVEISGPVPLPGGGVSRLTLAPAAAPVSLTEIELPADLAWSAPGTVVVEDRVEGSRRTVRLTSRRGQAQTVEVRRKLDGGDAERLLAQSLMLTLIQLRPDGPRRHDVVLYEVSRGGIGSFTVDLPPGLAVETVGTDEGEVVPTVESRRLTVQRRQQLRGVGYLVLTSTPEPGSALPLDPVVPEGTVRARYMALASSVAAEVKPLPEASWSRIDLDDLPPVLRDALNGIDLAAAWRLSGEAPGLRMAVSPLPAAPSLPAVASLRETTTLITLDGTLLHRDQITLRPGAIGTALDLTLPASATLWSAKVDGVPVRPLERGGGKISVPLGFDTGRDAVVEVISVQEKAIPKGRSDLALDLPRMAVPVQQHRWRLLLPDNARYRYRTGELRPVVEAPKGPARRFLFGQAAARGSGRYVSKEELEKIPTARDPWAILMSTPGVLTDRINVGGNETGQQSQYVGPGAIGPGAILRGRVVDDQGQPLPGVTVTLRRSRGEPSAVKVANAEGLFLFEGLAPGSYAIQAELEGFSTVSFNVSSLGAGQTRTVELRLSAAVEDVITVTAEAPILDERRTSKTETYSLDEKTGGGSRRKQAPPPPPSPSPYEFAEEAKSLKQGLVGGVKPLPIAIPETGKLLLLSGVLPPERIGVELEVKGEKEGRRWF